jgi:hypothetical protein
MSKSYETCANCPGRLPSCSRSMYLTNIIQLQVAHGVRGFPASILSINHWERPNLSLGIICLERSGITRFPTVGPALLPTRVFVSSLNIQLGEKRQRKGSTSVAPVKLCNFNSAVGTNERENTASVRESAGHLVLRHGYVSNGGCTVLLAVRVR